MRENSDKGRYRGNNEFANYDSFSSNILTFYLIRNAALNYFNYYLSYFLFNKRAEMPAHTEGNMFNTFLQFLLM